MKVQVGDPSKGILYFERALRHFSVERYPVSPDLQAWIEGFWSVSWDLPGGEEFLQSNLSQINVNIVFEDDGVWFYGVPDRIFQRRLAGAGHVLGVKFLPGGFYPFARRDLSQWTGKRVDLRDVLGDEFGELTDIDWRAMTLAQTMEHCERTFRRHLPKAPSRSAIIAKTIMESPLDSRISEIAKDFYMDERTLQRLLHQEVGISPKEILRRHRLHAAAERLLRERELNCGDLAQSLGYSDQAHFNRDFKAVIGRSPGEYQSEQIFPHNGRGEA